MAINVVQKLFNAAGISVCVLCAGKIKTEQNSRYSTCFILLPVQQKTTTSISEYLTIVVV